MRLNELRIRVRDRLLGLKAPRVRDVGEVPMEGGMCIE